MDEETHTGRLLIIGIFTLILFVVFLSGVLLIKTEKNKNKIYMPYKQEQIISDKAYLSLSLEQKEPIFAGQKIPISVLSSSQGVSVEGYDVVIIFDNSLLEFESAKSLLPDFDVITTSMSKGKVILTGVKKIKASEKTPFSGENIARVIFKSLNKGKADIKVLFEPQKKYDSNIMDSKNRDILNKVSGVKFNIQ